LSDTINYTLQPANGPDDVPIPDASLRMRYGHYDAFDMHRFDIAPKGIRYYRNGIMQHQNNHSIPSLSGTFQAAFWSNGDNFWSGQVSTTDVFMALRSIKAYYNSTNAQENIAFFEQCERVGGASELTICEEDQGTTGITRAVHTSTSVHNG